MTPPKESPIDPAAAHRLFSSDCFNKAWDLIDKAQRTPDEEEEMLSLSMTSRWHWTQREDFAPDKASVGNWQVSRVFALLGQAANARRFGRLSLAAVKDEPVSPFFAAYAHEALARAEALDGNTKEMEHHLDQARQLAAELDDEESRSLILSDLETIGRD